MDGLDPAIGYPHQIANDAIPVSNHPMTMTGSSPVMTGSDRCVRYVNSQGGWYYSERLAAALNRAGSIAATISAATPGSRSRITSAHNRPAAAEVWMP